MLVDKTITQIIGLPRSRTAWLSVALHGRGVHGFHDLVGSGMDEETYKAKLGAVPEPCVVDCSSALIGWQNLIEAVDSQIVIIERDEGEALASYVKHVGKPLAERIWTSVTNNFRLLQERFKERIVGRFKFDDLKDHDTILAIFKLVAPWPQIFDSGHCDRLQQLNIQEVMPPWAGHLH